MTATRGTVVFLVATFALAAVALVDLTFVESGSLTIYTTPALRDLLEKGLAPRWRAQHDLRIEPVYVAAGEQYNRLRMSGDRPEADLFLHASPLYLAKGFDEGYMLPIAPELAQGLNSSYRSDQRREDGIAWYAFAWSPLVEVFSPRLVEPPDLATAELKFGLAHPTLSNNGIYTVLFFEAVSPEAAQHARSRTVVQPVNARTNILGVADGSFDVTLGYEAVAKFFQSQGARIAYGAPLVAGKNVSTPVLFSVALVDGPRTSEATRFIDFLFTDETQRSLREFHFRSVYNMTPPDSPVPSDIRMVLFDWADWRDIEALLPRYEVIPNRD